MTEEQLRDVLARVVPEPPDSVADPAPVVRAARVRRRVQVALAGGAVAVVAVAGVLGGRALVDDDPGPQVADEESLSADPYAALPCPDVLPDNGPMPDLRGVTAIRYCGAGWDEFSAQPGPPDALVYGIDDFASALTAVPDADPARCAAVDVIPSDSRLAYQLADGSLTFTPVTMCTDVTVGGRTVDGAEVALTFYAALDSQRYAVDYSADDPSVGCEEAAGPGPVQPGRETLVAAAWCFGQQGTPIGPRSLELLNDSWDRASSSEPAAGDGTDPCLGDELPHLLVRTDRGDVLQLSVVQCERLSYTSWEPDEVYTLDVDVDDLTES